MKSYARGEETLDYLIQMVCVFNEVNKMEFDRSATTIIKRIKRIKLNYNYRMEKSWNF